MRHRAPSKKKKDKKMTNKHGVEICRDLVENVQGSCMPEIAIFNNSNALRDAEKNACCIAATGSGKSSRLHSFPSVMRECGMPKAKMILVSHLISLAEN